MKAHKIWVIDLSYKYISRDATGPERPSSHLRVISTSDYTGESFCEARRASHCHSPQTTYSSKSTCCTVSAQKTAMYVVVYAGRLTAQNSIVEIIN